MKITLPATDFVFTPSTNTIDFSPMLGAFKPERLLAVINTTTGKLVYAAASQAAGYGGTFSTTTYANDTLTYASSNVGQASGDIIEVLYDSELTSQLVSGVVKVQDANGLNIGSAPDPLTGDNRLFTQSSVQAGDGTPILSTYDPLSGEDGLNVNLLNSSFGGQVGSALPIPNNNNALSMAFLNGSVLSAPRMDPVTNELIVQGSFTAPALQDVNLTQVNGSGLSLGQNTMANSLPVTMASNQTAIPITTSSPIEVSVKQSVSQDILGVAIGGNRNNQIEVSFNAAPGATLITNTFTGAGSVSIANGHSVYQTGTVGAAASAQAVSVQTTTYRPAHEIYAAFTAAFTNMVATRSDAKIGLFDANNGFFVGYDITQGFGVGTRTAATDTIIPRASWNTDLLNGGGASKFTRNGTPEAINFAFSNLFRIRFAWLGSANIFFEVFSPDGEWVLFHNVRQPNLSFNPSIENPNLPMTVRVSKTAGTQNSQVATACWGAGTTSAYSPITETLNDKSLAALTRSVITGVTTGGGGGYVNVKVNPSGALVTDSTISGTVSTNITQYGGTGTTLGQKASSASMPVVIASDQSTVNTSLPDLYITGAPNLSAGNNNLLAAAGPGELDVSGYKSAAVQVISAATSGTFIFEGSNSTTSATFQAIPAFRLDSASPNAILTAITATSSNFIYIIPIRYRYMRMRVVTGLSTTVTALTRLSQDPFVSPVHQVINATAANLNATVAGALTSVGTITTLTTCSTVTTVSAVTSAALAATTITDIASAAITTTQTSANIVTGNQQNMAFQIGVSATSGTNQTLDVVVQETFDGTTYYDIYHFPRITAVGQYRSPQIRTTGAGIRYVRTVGGTTPSFTNSVLRPVRQTSSDLFRNFFDRTLDPNTLGSTTATFFIDGCDQMQLAVTMNAGGTAPIIKMQGSEDSLNWYDLPSMSITAAVGAVTQIMSNATSMPRFVRSIVATAGVGSSLANVDMKGRGV
jgi:hypothetical protein